jgi:abortive infection bacteriophage resistance protein
MLYGKDPLEFKDQLALMTSRGLIVKDPERALRWLKNVSYYRLSVYFLPFKDPNTDAFRPGCEFEQIIELYKFDGRLRLLVLQAIERVEIAIRTAITYQIAMNYGKFGHVDKNNFAPDFDSGRFEKELSAEEGRSREDFVTHYRSKYTLEKHLPVWMATELISFGTLSLMYKSLRPSIQKAIATDYGVEGDVFRSWLHTFSYVRNNCAHHKRFWDRSLAIRPKIPSRWRYSPLNSGTAYCVIVLLKHMTDVICPSCKWKERVTALVDDRSLLTFNGMGFPRNWREVDPWK